MSEERHHLPLTTEFTSTWVQGCDLEPSPWQSDNMNKLGTKHFRSFECKIEQVGLCVRDSAVIYLRHLHGNTFREIPLNVFKVYLSRAACYMRQLRDRTSCIVTKPLEIWKTHLFFGKKAD